MKNNGQLFYCGDLLRTDWGCTEFYVPNGGFTCKDESEYIDYVAGTAKRFDSSQFATPPAPLPASTTEGAMALDIYSNIFGNIPPMPNGYVERPAIQQDLEDRLGDKNHSIITLHGRGGIGKTSLALYAAHRIASCDNPLFDHVLWLSARDLELKPSGSAGVRRAVANLDEVCRLISKLLDVPANREGLAELLQRPSVIGSKGCLFIFDNFETFDDPRGLHLFLDRHTYVPNKVLITSRERAFQADYPIPVGGMEFGEAKELIEREGGSLGIGNILNDDAIREIVEYTDGHAYVMRVLLGEIAKDKKWVPLKSLVPRRGDLLNDVFERSFNRLTPIARWVFCLVGCWRSVVSELAILVTVGRRDPGVQSAIDECLRLSLLTRHELKDGQLCYSAPELAQLFAKKKLEGDPDRMLIKEDLAMVQQFGSLKAGRVGATATDDLVNEFVTQISSKLGGMEETDQRLADEVLERVAENWPKAWALVAQVRLGNKRSVESVAYAFRRAVEEAPYDKNAWIERARFAESVNDEATSISSYVSAVELDPFDVGLLREVAYKVCRFVDARKFEIPEARRGLYLASVRSHLEKHASKLDPDGLSRLAWLFLLEGDRGGAWKYANMGLKKDPTNDHCLKIAQRLDGQQEHGGSGSQR